MSTRNFDAFMAPRAVALIGASNREGSVGAVLARNLSAAGFQGDLFFVNRHAQEIDGKIVFASLSALPRPPDLAIIATPAAGVPSLISELGQRGCRAAIVISAGDHTFRRDVLEAAQPHLMRIIGPNCLGLLSPGIGLNASFAPLTPRSGGVALITQSGAIATAMLDWAEGQGIGFSHVFSLGDMADVDFGDVLNVLADDAKTRAILLYIEQITHAGKFMAAARKAALAKPVIVVKSGRGAAGARAAASHTGALAGADAVYDAAFRRAGMLRVDTLRDLFDAAETLSAVSSVTGDRLMIISNGGGLGVLAADALEAAGARLAPLSEPTLNQLNAVLPPTWSRANPIDIIGDADGRRYADTLEIVQASKEADVILVMNCPTGVSSNTDCARAVAGVQRQAPLIACWTGGAHLSDSARIFSQADIPCFDAPEDAIGAFLHVMRFSAGQRKLSGTPAPPPARDVRRIDEVATILNVPHSEGRTLLTEVEAKRVLALYGVETARTITAITSADAGAAAAEIGGTVALKILSRDITHKSDVGGVSLNLAPDQVEAAATEMLRRVQQNAPDARLDGFTVQEMIERPHAQELIVGASVDATFGPVLLFGQGGVAVELTADTTTALPPLDLSAARDMIERTRIAKLLHGFRDRKPADFDAIARVLAAVSSLIIDHSAIAELDINPLLADARGAIALDARIVLTTEPRQALAML